MMKEIVSTINDIVWNPGLVALLLLAGLFFFYPYKDGPGKVLRADVPVSLQQKTGN